MDEKRFDDERGPPPRDGKWPPWLTTRTARRFAALLGFLRSQTAGGMALIATTVLALVWSNASGADNYHALLGFRLGILPLEGWVNDGLMALFFLTVALEIRREITDGQLSSRRQVVAPGLAALGGMVVPALIYIAFNYRDPARLHGWAVPMATDIAFALATVSMLGRRIPIGLKLFLTALAIIDDLGAIVVIALFYTANLEYATLLAGCAICAGLYALNRAGLRALWPYALGGALLWVCLLRSGVHPTIGGVALAFTVPMDDTGQRMEAGLGRWVTWVVLPLFGLTNAGLPLAGVTPADFGEPALLGIVLGLVVGKPVGVFGATWAAIRLGWARMPAGLGRSHLAGAAMLCGIGFTMSLFIGDLGFHGLPLHAEVKLAVFTGSLLSAIVGLAWLGVATPRRRPG